MNIADVVRYNLMWKNIKGIKGIYSKRPAELFQVDVLNAKPRSFITH